MPVMMGEASAASLPSVGTWAHASVHSRHSQPPISPPPMPPMSLPAASAVGAPSADHIYGNAQQQYEAFQQRQQAEYQNYTRVGQSSFDQQLRSLDGAPVSSAPSQYALPSTLIAAAAAGSAGIEAGAPRARSPLPLSKDAFSYDDGNDEGDYQNFTDSAYKDESKRLHEMVSTQVRRRGTRAGPKPGVCVCVCVCDCVALSESASAYVLVCVSLCLHACLCEVTVGLTLYPAAVPMTFLVYLMDNTILRLRYEKGKSIKAASIILDVQRQIKLDDAAAQLFTLWMMDGDLGTKKRKLFCACPGAHCDYRRAAAQVRL
jgi:hypothetical protein